MLDAAAADEKPALRFPGGAALVAQGKQFVGIVVKSGSAVSVCGDGYWTGPSGARLRIARRTRPLTEKAEQVGPGAGHSESNKPDGVYLGGQQLVRSNQASRATLRQLSVWSPMMKEELPWRVYERIVAAAEAEECGIDLSVTPNARLTGKISGKCRQIDVLIDARWGNDLSDRIIVDAKLRSRPIDITAVESFEGMMKDCSAHRGVIVCANGYTDGALKRAQDAITIKLLRVDEVDEYVWAAFEPCMGECARASNSSGGFVLWDGQHPLPLGPGWAIVFTGKCDVCHEFHVWCWDCGEQFALSSEDEHRCGCERIWVSAIEQETDEVEEAHLIAIHLLVTDGDEVLALDRRALR